MRTNSLLPFKIRRFQIVYSLEFILRCKHKIFSSAKKIHLAIVYNYKKGNISSTILCYICETYSKIHINFPMSTFYLIL